MLYKKILCVLVAIGIGVTADFNLDLNRETATVNEGETVTFTCSVQHDNNTKVNITWIYESGEEVSNEQVENADYQELPKRDYITNTTRVRLHVYGKDCQDGNADYERTFKCQANLIDSNTGKSEENHTSVQVYINVPLTVEKTEEPPSYLCYNETTTLACLFRSFPKPKDVDWQNEGSETTKKFSFSNVTVIITELSEVSTSGNVSCSASHTTVDNNTFNESETFLIKVRDEKLDLVTHNNSDINVCRIQWNDTGVPSFTTGYQISYFVKNIEVFLTLPSKEYTSFEWKLTESTVPVDLGVALVMDECIGPISKSIGNCIYQKVSGTEEPIIVQDNTNLIIVSTVLSVIIVFLIAAFGIYIWKNRNKATETNDQKVKDSGHGGTTAGSMNFSSLKEQDHSQPRNDYDNSGYNRDRNNTVTNVHLSKMQQSTSVSERIPMPSPPMSPTYTDMSNNKQTNQPPHLPQRKSSQEPDPNTYVDIEQENIYEVAISNSPTSPQTPPVDRSNKPTNRR